MRCSLTTIVHDALDARLPCAIPDALRATLYGFAARGIRNIEIINGHLFITLTDGTVIDVGAVGEDKKYVHHQTSAASVWEITHNLDKYPSVTVADSANSVVVGDVRYLDSSSLIITFSAPFSGTAYLN